MVQDSSKGLERLANGVAELMGQPKNYTFRQAFNEVTGSIYDSSLRTRIGQILGRRSAAARAKSELVAAEKKSDMLSDAIELETLELGREYGYHLSRQELWAIKAEQERMQWEVVKRE